MRVDAHHHLWHYNAEDFEWIVDSAASLRRDFLISDLEAAMAAANVDAAIAVQARCSLEETSWLLACAQESSKVVKVVGWVPLASPDLRVALDRFADNTTLAGFRDIVQDQAAGFLLASAFNEGIRQLTARSYTYDLLIRASQLEEASRFVDLHPRQRFVVDHAAKPDIAHGELAPWQAQITWLAERPHVYCKLSGLVTEADWQRWTEAEIQPYLDICLEAFGPTRCMAGSDWPVCLVATSYTRWWQLLERWTQQLSHEEQSRILGLTAAEFYGVTTGLNVPSEVSR